MHVEVRNSYCFGINQKHANLAGWFTLSKEVLEISKEDCETIHNEETYTFHLGPKTVIINTNYIGSAETDMFLAGISFTGNISCIGTTSNDRFYASKEIPMDHGKGKIVMAAIRLDIETEAFQINMETNTLMIPRLGITQTINKTNQFTIKNKKVP